MADVTVRAVLVAQDNMSAAMKGATAAVAALGGAAAAAVGQAVELNRGMANVASLIPGQAARVRELRDSVQDLSIKYGEGSGGLTNALYQTISAFGDSADTVSILETATRTASAGAAEAEDAINLLSAVTKGYGDTSAGAVEKASNLATLTVRLGQTTFPELARSIGRVTPLASELGVAQEHLFAIMATGTGVVGTASEVSTQLRGVLASMLAPTSNLSNLYDELGVSGAEAMIRQHGLAGSISLMAEDAEKTGRTLKDYIASTEALPIALNLAGAGADVFADKLAEMENAAGATDSAFREQTEGVNSAEFAYQQMKNTATAAVQDVGQAVLDTMGRGGAAFLAIGEFGGTLSSMAPQITAAWLIAGPKMGGILTGLTTAFRLTWAAAFGPIGIGIAAVTALGTALYGLWSWMRKDSDAAYEMAEGVSALEASMARAAAEAAALEANAPTETGYVGDVDAALTKWRKRAEELEEAERKAREEAAELARVAREEANKAFMEWAESTHALNVALSAQALKSTSIIQGFREAGNNAGLEFDLAFMSGPGGVMTTVPKNMMTLAEDGSWMLAGGKGGEAMAQAANDAVKGFDWSGMFTGAMSAFHGFIDGGWKGGLSQLANTALSFLPPGMAQAAQAALGAFKAVWDKWFKKPSEAEIQAREAFAGVGAGFKEELGGMAKYQEYFNSLLDQGWDANTAEVKAGFDYWGRQAGATWDEIGRLYGQYQDAVKAGDAEEMARIDAIVQGWRDRGQAAIDEGEALAAAHQQFMDGVFNTVVSAWDRAEKAGTEAYDKVYDEAIEAGAGAEQAARMATAASEEARNQILAAEKDKYVRLAAFEAALAEIRAGNAEGALDAARRAAHETEQAWDLGLNAVATASDATSAALQRNAVTTADLQIDQAERAADGINAAGASVQPITVPVTYDAGPIPGAATPGFGEGEFEGRARGGPVSAGSPYVVGERGPEVFVPNRSGSVIPNGQAPIINIEVNEDRSGRWTARRVAHALGETMVIA